MISRVLLKFAPWDAVDSAFEARIPFDSAVDHADELRRAVAAGRATCAQIHHAGERVGLLIFRVEEDKARELVIVALFVAGPCPLTAAVSDAVDALAQAERCTSIRFHTVRPGLARLAADSLGYRLAEIILRKDVQI